MSSTGGNLNAGQQQALERLLDWWEDPFPRRRYFVLNGAAGTGKTTTVLAAYLELRRRYPLIKIDKTALPGKAASVLRSRGLQAALGDEELNPFKDAINYHPLIYKYDGMDLRNRPRFIAKTRREVNRDGVFCDEASMVPIEDMEVLLQVYPRVIFIGDSNQLPPVGEGRDPDLFSDVDATLTEITRQSAGNPIIRFSQDVLAAGPRREPGIWPGWVGEDAVPQVMVEGMGEFLNYHFRTADIMLCRYNKTRLHLNRLRCLWERGEKEIPEDHELDMRRGRGERFWPQVGDRIVSLKNGRYGGVSIRNGECFRIETCDIMRGEGVAVVSLSEPDLGRYGRTIPSVAILLRQFGLFLKGQEGDGQGTVQNVPSEVALFDHGWALTVQRAQGSEWNRVAFFDEPRKGDRAQHRFRYTAVTRAREELAICCDRTRVYARMVKEAPYLPAVY